MDTTMTAGTWLGSARMPCRFPGCTKAANVASFRGICPAHTITEWRDAGLLICTCPTAAEPGECPTCHRLVAA